MPGSLRSPKSGQLAAGAESKQAQYPVRFELISEFMTLIQSVNSLYRDVSPLLFPFDEPSDRLTFGGQGDSPQLTETWGGNNDVVTLRGCRTLGGRGILLSSQRRGGR